MHGGGGVDGAGAAWSNEANRQSKQQLSASFHSQICAPTATPHTPPHLPPPKNNKTHRNRFATSFSDSPIHLDTRSELLTEKNVASASVATAFARYDLPVPGGP